MRNVAIGKHHAAESDAAAHALERNDGMCIVQNELAGEEAGGRVEIDGWRSTVRWKPSLRDKIAFC